MVRGTVGLSNTRIRTLSRTERFANAWSSRQTARVRLREAILSFLGTAIYNLKANVRLDLARRRPPVRLHCSFVKIGRIRNLSTVALNN